MAATVTIKNGATWQEVAADRQKHRDATLAEVEPALGIATAITRNTLPIAKQLLTEQEIKITETTVEDLVKQIANSEISSVDVVKAFLRRAVLAQTLTNCVTEVLPDRAIERAKYLDEYLAKNGRPVGVLHGIPISVKEHIGMKGLDHNAGYVGWVGGVAEDDAQILKILWAAGAVFYVRTTQPQCLMHLETSSNLYGTTTNPFNTTLTPGGSSGGEGAIIGFRGSCLGIGTDIGGSIRGPAANCGVYGLKPTTRRLPNSGLIAASGPQENIVPTIGPLSTSLEGVKIFTKTLIDAKPWLHDPALLPFPWKEEDFFQGRKIKVAVIWDDGVVKPHPPVTRALKQVVDKLAANDKFEVVEWKPYEHYRAWEIIANLYFYDGGKANDEAIATSNEPWLPLSLHIAKNKYVEHHTVTSMYEAVKRRDAYRIKYAELWNDTATSVSADGVPEGMVDVILCPVGPGSAPKHETAKWWGYTSQWNLLDYPGLVFPVDQVDVKQDSEETKYEPRNEWDQENWALWEKYGAEGYKDAPLSLQLVGRRYEDERVIQALEVIKAETGLPFVSYI